MAGAGRCGEGSVNAGAGGSPIVLGVMDAGPWTTTAGFARVTVAVVCMFGCGTGGGAVGTGKRGVCGGSRLDCDGWGVNGGMLACLACTGGGGHEKSFEMSEGA